MEMLATANFTCHLQSAVASVEITLLMGLREEPMGGRHTGNLDDPTSRGARSLNAFSAFAFAVSASAFAAAASTWARQRSHKLDRPHADKKACCQTTFASMKHLGKKNARVELHSSAADYL